MSECVVRMEMPESCEKCPACDYEEGNCLLADDRNTLQHNGRRRSWCPILCQLPEGHGRLMDKDEVIESIRTEVTELFFNGLKGTPRPDGDLRFMWNRLEDEDFAPTIVPADTAERSEIEQV